MRMTVLPMSWCAASRPVPFRAGAVLCLLPLGLSGCGSAGFDSSLSPAEVRFVQVSPGSPEMDFYVNGAGAAYSVGYANFTSYLPVSPGPVNVSARRTGTAGTLSSGDATLSAGRRYTALISHGLGNLQERIYLDQDTPASPGQVAVRVLNEVEGIASVTVYLSPTGSGGAAPAAPASVLNLGSGVASGYVNVASGGTYTVSATTTAGALNVPIGTAILKAASGSAHTVVFAGTAQPAGGHSVAGFVLDDADAP